MGPGWRQGNGLNWLLLAAAAIVLNACGGALKPDLNRLYANARNNTEQPPVIVIHGILGGKLQHRESGLEHWTGDLWQLLFSDYQHLAQQIDGDSLTAHPGDLNAYRITDRAAGRNYYGAILDTLEDAGGFSRARAGQPPTGKRNYYVFVYDWRQDNVESARKLSRMIEQIRADYGQPDLQVDLIAHSMGGLIARYYLRYGEQDVLDSNEFPANLWGAERVRRVLLLGTPNLGSADSLHAFIRGYRIGLGRIPTEALATMPSVYQLFPHPLKEWLYTVDGRPLKRDLFDVRIWRRFQWSVFDPQVEQRVLDRFEDRQTGEQYLRTLQAFFGKQLERARRFVWSLTVELENAPWELVVFGGDCHMTPASLVVEEVDGISEIRLWPKDIDQPADGVDYEHLMLEPGDGTVTKSSLLARQTLDPSVPRHPYSFFPLDYAMFLCEEHQNLTGNISFQDNLLQVLLSRD